MESEHHAPAVHTAGQHGPQDAPPDGQGARLDGDTPHGQHPRKHAHLSAGRAETNRLGCDRMTGLACICFGFVLGTAFTAVCLLADKKKAPARSCTSDKRNPKG